MVEFAWALHNLGEAANGEYWHLTRKHGTQRVDGLDLQSRRVIKEIPVIFPIAFQNGARKLTQTFLVRLIEHQILVGFPRAPSALVAALISPAAFRVNVIATTDSERRCPPTQA